MTFLVVDDEQLSLDINTSMLENMGYNVLQSESIEETIQILNEEEDIDLILLDYYVADIRGVNLIKEIKRRTKIPIIVLSAETSLQAKINCLDAGADDFVLKPFNIEELQARIRAALRHSQRLEVAENFVLKYDKCIIKKDNKEIPLTQTDFKILYFLVQHPDEDLSYKDICIFVWGTDKNKIDTLRVHVNHLRNLIGNNFIYTINGYGYRWVLKKRA